MAQAERDVLIDALAQRLCDQQYPPGYNEDGISLPEGGWADGMADPSKASREFLEAWRDKARNVIALLDDAGFDVVNSTYELRCLRSAVWRMVAEVEEANEGSLVTTEGGDIIRLLDFEAAAVRRALEENEAGRDDDD